VKEDVVIGKQPVQVSTRQTHKEKNPSQSQKTRQGGLGVGGGWGGGGGGGGGVGGGGGGGGLNAPIGHNSLWFPSCMSCSIQERRIKGPRARAHGNIRAPKGGRTFQHGPASCPTRNTLRSASHADPVTDRMQCIKIMGNRRHRQTPARPPRYMAPGLAGRSAASKGGGPMGSSAAVGSSQKLFQGQAQCARSPARLRSRPNSFNGYLSRQKGQTAMGNPQISKSWRGCSGSKPLHCAHRHLDISGAAVRDRDKAPS